MNSENQVYYVQNVGNAWNYQVANGVSRFEVRGGDNLAGDGQTKERSEIASAAKMQIGQTYEIRFSVMVEPGAKNTADWMTLVQLQSTFDKGEAGHSPAFALEMVGDKMRIVTRDSSVAISTEADIRYVRHYTDVADIARGHWYDFKIEIKFDPFGQGHLVVSRDGVQLVDFQSALGFNDLVGAYFKEGVYRESSPETFAANFKGLSIQTVSDTVIAKPAASPAASSSSSSSSSIAHVDSVVVSAPPEPAHAVVSGTANADTLTSASKTDILHGEAGNDLLMAANGAYQLDGGAGVDTVSFKGLTSAIAVDLGVTTAQTTALGSMTFINIENLTGGSGADKLTGNDFANFLDGGLGNDFLYGKAGDDILHGGAGNDVLDGGLGRDTGDWSDVTTAIIGNEATGVVNTGDGFIDTVSSIEVWKLGSGSDTLVTQGASTVYAGAGNDTLSDSGAQANTFYGEAGDDRIDGMGGNDFISGGDGNDRLLGGSGNDILIGGAGADTMDGGAGKDIFQFLAMTDLPIGKYETINGFESGIDKLDFSAIDADGKAANGDTAFKLVSQFHGVAGELLVSHPAGANYYTVQLDTNLDHIADATLIVYGPTLVASDFIL
ncbi:heparin lyase I family protein [Caulobacter sp. UNC279MFTsu5.1]|uniref:heparin lyase I family protein n=1 Tax=Caulobacter sp. UNC279MFTsu5.1 TaxID=1502775 RepID=UPI0008ED56B5|nr:heparin lyase I family protein [Caulobacter sp. UNC279MFTsu5.1]SFJ41111.1 Hemolysin-type calcium-binding repeat-containing protein [Caulobacter sp. UNC279MFTsu5.1]